MKQAGFVHVLRLFWLAVTAAGLFTGCTTTGGLALPQDQKVVYDLDLSGTIDGVQWDGTAIGSADKKHVIDIVSKTDVNFFRVISCHRYKQFEDAIITHWLQPNRAYEYTYEQSPGLEDNGECLLRLQAFTKAVDSNGLPVGSAYGLVVFHNPKFTLPAENLCNGANGDDAKTAGTSICKSMNGLVQRLQFNTQVIAAGEIQDPNVPQACHGKFIDAYTWEYTMPLGECVSVFAEVAQPHRRYIHWAYGFNKSQYRGVK